MTDREFVLSNIEVIDTRANGQKVKVVKHKDTRIYLQLPVDAAEDDITNAKEKIADNILKWYDVVEDENGEMVLKRKEV